MLLTTSLFMKGFWPGRPSLRACSLMRTITDEALLRRGSRPVHVHRVGSRRDQVASWLCCHQGGRSFPSSPCPQPNGDSWGDDVPSAVSKFEDVSGLWAPVETMSVPRLSVQGERGIFLRPFITSACGQVSSFQSSRCAHVSQGANVNRACLRVGQGVTISHEVAKRLK